MARKFRCPKCNEIFVGKMAHCPKCGIELHYQNENEIQKKEVVETNSNKPTFHFDDDDIIKSNIDVLFIAEQQRWGAHFCIRKELLPSSRGKAPSLRELAAKQTEGVCSLIKKQKVECDFPFYGRWQ